MAGGGGAVRGGWRVQRGAGWQPGSWERGLSLLCGLNGHYPDSEGGKKHCRGRLWVLSMQGRVRSAGESLGGMKQLRWKLTLKPLSRLSWQGRHGRSRASPCPWWSRMPCGHLRGGGSAAVERSGLCRRGMGRKGRGIAVHAQERLRGAELLGGACDGLAACGRLGWEGSTMLGGGSRT